MRLDEDGGHIFLRCKFVKQVWRQMNLEEIRLQLMEKPNAVVVVEAVCSLSAEVQCQVAVLLWDCWTTRNKIYAGEKAWSASEVTSMVQRHLLDFAPVVLPQIRIDTPATRWEPPRRDFVKVNFDAAFKQDARDGAYGYVLRSDEGELIAAGAGKFTHVKNALQAEAEACLAAIEGASNAGVHHIMLESDSLSLVQALPLW
ncbi:hypothetical protein VPH35_046564 [Triticum aestivum]